MRRCKWWAAAVIAAALACSPALAQPVAPAGEDAAPKKAKKRKARKPRKGKPPKKGLRGEYAIMVKICTMDEIQQAKLKESLEKQKVALKEWNDGPNGQKLQQLRKAYAEARKAKDADEIKKLRGQIKPLQQELSKLQAANREAIMAILTPEQKLKWGGFTLYRDMMRRYKRLKLTEEQTQQVRDLCNAGAKELGQKMDDRKARGQASRKIRQEIEQKVLNDLQREELKKKPEKAPRKKPREKAPRAKKPKKDRPAALD